MSKPYTMDDVRAWVEMRWERERLDEKVMARIRATVEERDALKAEKEQEWQAHLAEKAAFVSEVASLKAQVEAARKALSGYADCQCGNIEPHHVLEAMDEAAKK